MLRRSRRARSAPTVALAGAGSIAVVHALSAGPAGASVVAVASAGGTSARHLAGNLDARRVRPEDLPAGADLLVVATPPAAHAAPALAGIAAGSRVLIEKPLTTTLADADRLVAAAGAPDAPVVRCAENLLLAPAWLELGRRRARLGALGHLSLRTLQPPPDWGHFAEPLRDGGVLFDLGPHPLALAMSAAGEAVTGVAADLGSSRADGADDHAAVELHFGSGLRAQLEVSWVSDELRWDLQAASDRGVLRLELLPEVLLEEDGEHVELIDRLDVVDPRLERMGYVDQLVDVLGDARRAQTVSAARDVLEVICAAYASAGAGGGVVALPFDGDRRATPRQLWGR